jgi:hypothetical protein
MEAGKKKRFLKLKFSGDNSEIFNRAIRDKLTKNFRQRGLLALFMIGMYPS